MNYSAITRSTLGAAIRRGFSLPANLSVDFEQAQSDAQGRPRTTLTIPESVDRGLAAGDLFSQLGLGKPSGQDLSRDFLGIHASTLSRSCLSRQHQRDSDLYYIRDMDTLAKRLIWARTRKGLTQEQLADLGGVSQSTIGNLEAGIRKTARNILAIAAAVDVDANWLAEGRGDPPIDTGVMPAITSDMQRVVIADADDPNFYQIQKVQLRLRAGVTGYQTVPEIYDGSTLSVPRNWVDRNGYRAGALIAVKVKGDSMEPNLYEGDLVIINTDDKKMVDGTVYAFNYEGEAVIKRLVRERGSWWLYSDNQDQSRHRPRGCTDGECLVIGRVIKRETERI